jgi:hypothetical protein
MITNEFIAAVLIIVAAVAAWLLNRADGHRAFAAGFEPAEVEAQPIERMSLEEARQDAARWVLFWNERARALDVAAYKMGSAAGRKWQQLGRARQEALIEAEDGDMFAAMLAYEVARQHDAAVAAQLRAQRDEAYRLARGWETIYSTICAKMLEL